MEYDKSHIFSKEQLIQIFKDCLEKTLGEVDKNNVFKCN